LSAGLETNGVAALRSFAGRFAATSVGAGSGFSGVAGRLVLAGFGGEDVYDGGVLVRSGGEDAYDGDAL
jgi:hypothetical protein